MFSRKQVPAKSYVSKYKDWSLSFLVPSDVGPVSDTIRFVNGEFTASLEDEQEHIEALAQFGPTGAVYFKPSPRVAIEATAVSLRAVAVKAAGAAKAAEDALAAWDKANAPAKAPAPAAAV